MRSCLSASQDIFCLLWNLRFHYRVLKRPPFVRILCQTNPVYAPPPCFIKSVLILSSLYMCLRSGALFMFFYKSSPISCLACETFPAPVLRLGVITLKYFAVYCIYSPRGVEADSHSPSQNVPAFYLTRWFISVFIGARRRSRS